MIDAALPTAEPKPAVGEPHLGWLVAGLCAAAGVVHFAMVPVHGGGQLIDSLGFAVAGWLQLAIAAVVLAARDTKNLYRVSMAVNAGIVAMWVWSRTAGLPYGSHANIAEPVGSVDTITSGIEVAAIVVAALVVLSPKALAVGKLAPAFLSVGVLGLASAVILSPDAATHNHSAEPTVDPVKAFYDNIDTKRCDKGFNLPAYWAEAKKVGIDTIGLTPPPATAAASSDGHNHGAAAVASEVTTTSVPTPLDGRGSQDLDTLVSLTSASSQGEAGAAALVSKLGEVDQGTYDSWLQWMASTGQASHSHSSASPTASGDSGGHGGHAAAQPWVALTNPKQCAELKSELKIAQDTALSYPTAADAMKAGWVRVTPYVPGIAAHYMNFSIVDDKFEVDKPEMILYDGNEADAHVVGLSYYLMHDGDAEPTQGFTGDNDHGHRHVGLCIGVGGVIGDSQTSEEDCAARGGRKSDGSAGWMIHAWVVPGCESPWGVFSAASPILDGALANGSGKNDKSCSASNVRTRYGMAEAPLLDLKAKAEQTSTGG